MAAVDCATSTFETAEALPNRDCRFSCALEAFCYPQREFGPEPHANQGPPLHPVRLQRFLIQIFRSAPAVAFRLAGPRACLGRWKTCASSRGIEYFAVCSHVDAGSPKNWRKSGLGWRQCYEHQYCIIVREPGVCKSSFIAGLLLQVERHDTTAERQMCWDRPHVTGWLVGCVEGSLLAEP